MHRTHYLRALLVAAAVIGAGAPRVALGAIPHAHADSLCAGDYLYVGDAGDNTVKRFCVQDRNNVVTFGSGVLDGPRGMLYEGNLLIANQNVDQSFAGEIDLFSHVDGKSLGALVPHADANAPFAPDGIIRGADSRTLYVADLEDKTGANGRVATYDINTGHFLGNLNFSSFINSTSNPTPGEFHPRGLVFGPDGLLYVSVRSLADGVSGAILSYNLHTGAVTVVARYNPSATDCTADLHRPDGLTFGPDGNLYVTSFRANSLDVDRILIFNGTGGCVGEIPLYQLPQPRAFAQYVLFGPGGLLYAPIVTTGEVRAYDVSTKSFVDFVSASGPLPAGGPLLSGWGLTFGQTNPVTLAYGS